MSIALLSTYCDNIELKHQIVHSRPSPDGLFLHELAMISYAEIGQINAEEPSFSSVFREMNVLYPRLLLASLVDRGYIQVQKSVNYLSFYRTAVLQEYAKKHGLKRPNNREKIIEIILGACTEKEIDGELSLRFYLPTDKGYLALRNSNFSLYSNKNDSEPVFNGNSVKEDEIVIHKAITEGIEISTEDSEKWKYYLVIDGIKMKYNSTIWVLPKRSDLYISKDGKIVYSATKVDAINFYYGQRKISFRTLSNPKEKMMLPAQITCFDLVSNSVKYSTFDDGNKGEMLDTFDMFVRKRVSENYEIIKNNKISYYVQVKSRIIEKIVSTIETGEFNPVKVIPIDSYLDDPTINAIVTVDLNDHQTRNIIQYMIREHLLEEVSIFDLSIRKIAFCLYCENIIANTKSVTIEEQFREWYSWNKEYTVLLEKLREVDKGLQRLNSYIWKFPCEIFQEEPFRNYTRPNDYNWVYAKQHEAKLRKAFNDHVISLKEKGILPSKWISELNLYFAIKKVYDDSIYQFRDEWLHLQSLDIYIPSKHVGIEYQGIQHYESVEIFGGEEGFRATKERDHRKARLCKQNGVRLLEWNYMTEVSEKNVRAFLQENNL